MSHRLVPSCHSGSAQMTVTNIFWRCGLLDEYMHASKTLKKTFHINIKFKKKKESHYLQKCGGGGDCVTN